MHLGSVQSMYDIRPLELVYQGRYDMGRFLMATGNPYYWKEPNSSGIRETFGIYQGRSINPRDEFVATT